MRKIILSENVIIVHFSAKYEQIHCSLNDCFSFLVRYMPRLSPDHLEWQVVWSPRMTGMRICMQIYVPANMWRHCRVEVGPVSQGPRTLSIKSFESMLLLWEPLLVHIKHTQECPICPLRGRQAAIFSRLPYLALEMVLNRQVVVAMVIPLHQQLNFGKATRDRKKALYQYQNLEM